VQSQYVWALSRSADSAPFAVFSWANVAKKYIRDTYTTDGELHLPPRGHLTLIRYKVNPKASRNAIWDELGIEEFLKA
jgi:hypothetical protein